MVERMAYMRAFALLPLMAALLVFFPHAAVGQELGEGEGFALSEEYRIELNEVGDAHITDVITYDQAWFDEYGYIFEENPDLLSRRYRSDSNVGEVENFDVDINARKAAVTISFDTPGLAYLLKDGWTVFGYGDYTLVSEGDDEVVLEAAWNLNNEWTLFETMGLEERVVIKLPAGAQHADFDERTGTLAYRLPKAESGKGFMAENKKVLIVVFSLLMALSFLSLLYLFTRRSTPDMATAAQPPTDITEKWASKPSSAPPMAPGVVRPTAGESDTPPTSGSSTTETAADVSAPTALYCRKCGYPRASAEERFCRRCGAPHGGV